MAAAVGGRGGSADERATRRPVGLRGGGGGMPDDSSTRLGLVEPGSAAEVAGLKVGDRIVSIDGEPLERFGDLVLAVRAHPARPSSWRSSGAKNS